MSLIVQIARNKEISTDEMLTLKGGPYLLYTSKPNPVTGDCSNSQLTLAFKKSNDKFSVGIVRAEDHVVWTINDLSFLPGTCNSTLLNEQ